MADVIFPRIIYRGAHDELGLGTVGEQKRCESADDWAAYEKAGWRLVSAVEPPIDAPSVPPPAVEEAPAEPVEEPEEPEAAPKARKPKAGK